MKLHALILAAGGLVGAATLAQAQTAPALPPGPLEHLQDVFGQVVGAGFLEGSDKAPAFREPAAVGLGEAGRAGLLATGGVFAGVVKPFADVDAAANPAPAAAASPARHRRHAHRRINPAAAG